ncbi:MAG: zinc ribbon domain-containing protein [bacterium]|nr:zinc ribbon domain-containing protein [bacterium]
MPVYEYRCQKCAETFSRLQNLNSAAKDVRCPSCESARVERILSVFASGTSSTASTGNPATCPSAAACASSGGGFT